MKELKTSTEYNDPWNQILERLIDHDIETNWLVMLGGDSEVSVTFVLNEPRKISGYAIRSAAYIAARDPRKWSVTFRNSL